MSGQELSPREELIATLRELANGEKRTRGGPPERYRGEVRITAAMALYLVRVHGRDAELTDARRFLNSVLDLK